MLFDPRFTMGRSSWLRGWHGEGGGREVLLLAWPLIVGNSLWTVQITLDRILLSRTSSDTVGAAMAAAMLFWTPLTLFQFTANYATTFVAQYSGAGQPRRVGPVVWQALYFSVLAGLAFIGLAPFAETIVAVGDHPAELQELEAVYFRCLCFAALPTLITAAATSFFAGRGDSKTVLVVNAASLFINAPLAYAWIFGYFGLPAWGIAGAGWATVIATTVSALLALVLFMLPRYRKEFATMTGWRFDARLFLRLLRFGLPSGVFVALDMLVFTVFLFLIGKMGRVQLDATSVTFTLNLISFLPIMGVGQAVGILVGQRLGENRPDWAARSAWSGLAIALFAMTILAVPYVFAPNLLTWVFRAEADTTTWEQVRELVPVLLRFVAFYCLFDSMNMVFSNALRGAGDTRFVTLAGMVLSWTVMVIPTCVALRFDWGLYWAWTFASAYVMALGLAMLARFMQGKWRAMRVIETASSS
jgi:multidrug resistance protein, MATE family